MYQLQYNRRSYTKGYEWLTLPEGKGIPVGTKEEAKALMKEYKRKFKHLFGYPCDLKLRIAEIKE